MSDITQICNICHEREVRRRHIKDRDLPKYTNCLACYYKYERNKKPTQGKLCEAAL